MRGQIDACIQQCSRLSSGHDCLTRKLPCYALVMLGLGGERSITTQARDVCVRMCLQEIEAFHISVFIAGVPPGLRRFLQVDAIKSKLRYRLATLGFRV